MSDLVEQINEARKVVEELGGKKTKSLDDLKGELDRMIEASKQPGYSPNDAETLIKKRELVVSAMETALHVLVNETLDGTEESTETVSATPTVTSSVPEVTQSAFAPASESPEPTKTKEPATGTRFERFMSGASSMASSGYDNVSKFLSWAGKGLSDFFSSAGTQIAALWNSWFGKKETTTTPATAQNTAEAVPVANPETQRPYDEAPESTSPAANEPPLLEPLAGNAPSPAPVQPAEPDPVTADTTSSARESTEAAVPTINLMDNKSHEIGGHQVIWTGKADNLFSVDGKKFGVGLGTHLLIGGLTSIRQKGDTVTIETIAGSAELTRGQIDSLMSQVLHGKARTEKKRFSSETYKVLPVTIEYTKISKDIRTAGSQQIELLPE